MALVCRLDKWHKPVGSVRIHGHSKNLEKLWQLDRFPNDEESKTSEELRTEKIFHETFVQDPETGCGKVSIAWKENEPDLPDNFSIARRLYERDEARMIRNNASNQEKDFFDAELSSLEAEGFIKPLEDTPENRKGFFLQEFGR